MGGGGWLINSLSTYANEGPQAWAVALVEEPLGVFLLHGGGSGGRCIDERTLAGINQQQRTFYYLFCELEQEDQNVGYWGIIHQRRHHEVGFHYLWKHVKIEISHLKPGNGSG